MEHDEPDMVYVAPGTSGQLGWQFTRASDFYSGCLIPGHLDVGMPRRLRVK